MARPLTFGMDEIARGNTSKRQPAFLVLVYDTRSGENTVADVVLGNPLTPTTGPLDATPFVESVRVSEKAGDYIASGVSSSVMTGTLTDPNGQFDPDLVVDDPTALGRFFRRGNVVRVVVGDERLDPSEWVNTFTGRIAGQAGYVRTRVGDQAEISIKAYGREATFIPFERTSDEFTAGATYRSILDSVASAEMGLQVGEFIWSAGVGSHLLEHLSVTLAKENPVSMLAKVLLYDLSLPHFDGSGILRDTSGIVTANSDRFYETNDAILEVRRPQTEVQPPDSVCVVGLDFNLTKITQPRQVIAEMGVTTGYFTSGENLEVYWSDDRTKLAQNIVPQVLKSVNGGFTSLGGGEQFFDIASPSTNQVGTIGNIVVIDTGFAPWIGVFLLATYVILAAVPDIVVVVGFVASTGTTINVGGIAQAAALAGAMIVMTKIGRGQYRFSGEPFEYVYEKIRECATVDGVGEFERNEVEVENHLIDNRTQGRLIAKEMLLRQQARGRPRNVIMLHDPALEPDDTFELLADDRRFLVDSISYVLERGQPQVTSNVACFEVTTNVSRST